MSRLYLGPLPRENPWARQFVDSTAEEIARLAAVKAFKQLVSELPDEGSIPRAAIDGLTEALATLDQISGPDADG
jgi:hypothetical protein